LIGSALARQVQRLNTTQDFNVLNFQFEMIGKNIATREFSAMTKLPLRYILSAQDKGMGALSTTDLAIIRDYANKQTERKEFVVDAPMTVEQMRSTVAQFYAATRKPFLITLDHTLLVKQAASETSRTVTLQNLATMLVETKNKYPVSWIILTQLNREIDDAERQKPGQLSNYPGEADVYGSDFLLQCADVMIAYNRPAKYNLSLYGPLKYIITPEYKNLLAAHVLKNRYGEPSIQWYMADYQTMNLYETVAPQKKI
jgi:replicative DNA helicase